MSVHARQAIVTRARPKLPTVKELRALFVDLKADIADDYQVEGGEEDSSPSMSVTIGWTAADGSWSYQTGDNSFTGGAYEHRDWATVTLTRRCRSRDVARDVRSQLADLYWSADPDDREYDGSGE